MSSIPENPLKKPEDMTPALTLTNDDVKRMVDEAVESKFATLSKTLSDIQATLSGQEDTIQRLITASVAGFVTETQVTQRVNVEFERRFNALNTTLTRVASQQQIITDTLDARFDALMEKIGSNRQDIADNHQDIEANHQLATQAYRAANRAVESFTQLRIDLMGKDNPSPHDPKPILTVISENLADLHNHVTTEALNTRRAFGDVAKNIELRLTEDYGNLEQRVKRLERIINVVQTFGRALTSKKALAIGGTVGSVAGVLIKFVEFWSTH